MVKTLFRIKNQHSFQLLGSISTYFWSSVVDTPPSVWCGVGHATQTYKTARNRAYFNFETNIFGNLSTRVFARDVNGGSELLSLFTCPRTTTFTLLPNNI